MRKPKQRTQLRLKLGKTFFTVKRWLRWLTTKEKFAKRQENELPYNHFSHQTPLIRKLKDVEMYLQYNKITNLKIAVPKVNKITIRPGETFSYWKSIGKPTKRKGYKDGMILHNGTFKAGTGGGLCQLSNLIYWMTMHTPLTVTERHRHGYDVFPDANRTQPFGSGATCFYNYGDLMIKNNTKNTFQLLVEVTETDLKGEWRADNPLDCVYEVYEKEHIIKQEYWGGYTRHNVICRKKFGVNKDFTADEYITENHAIMMYAPLLEVNN